MTDPDLARLEQIADEFFRCDRLRNREAVINFVAEQRAEGVAEARGWQPIETAPRDGRNVLVFEPGGTYPSGYSFPATVGTAYWWNGDGVNHPGWNGPINPRGFPTHWMPLPDPPAALRPEGNRRCPTCDGPQPRLHPAVQYEGEVQPCKDPWHVRPEGKVRDE
jgi:hypothetical protein